MYCSSNEQGYYLIASRTFVNTTIYMYIQCKRLQCTGSERQTFTVYWIRKTNVYSVLDQKDKRLQCTGLERQQFTVYWIRKTTSYSVLDKKNNRLQCTG